MQNKIDLKAKNRNNIYKLICNSTGVSKQDIVQTLNLSLPTVSQNLTELKEQGLIGEYGTFESTGGRKARIIKSIDDARVAVGIDITRNHLSTVLIDMQGKVLHSKRERLEATGTDGYFKRVGSSIDDFIDETGIAPEKILGVGVSLPAILAEDRRKITYMTVLPAPEDVYPKLGKYMKYRFDFFNDANAGGFAEFWHRDTERSIVYISLSNSVGGSVIYSQSAYRGENQRAGEFGHITIVPDGRQCYCGQKGCADAYCNAKLLSDITNGDLNRFFKELEEGGKKHAEAFDEYLHYLSLLVNNLRMCFDCDVVLGGYVGSHMEKYVGRLDNLVNKLNPFDQNGQYVKVCNYKFEASAVGAALYYIDEYIEGI